MIIYKTGVIILLKLRTILIVTSVLLSISSYAFAEKYKSDCQCWAEAFAYIYMETCRVNENMAQTIIKAKNNAQKNRCLEKVDHDKLSEIWDEAMNLKKYNGCNESKTKLIKKYFGACAG